MFCQHDVDDGHDNVDDEYDGQDNVDGYSGEFLQLNKDLLTKQVSHLHSSGFHIQLWFLLAIDDDGD